MLAGAVLVWVMTVLGLRLLSGGGAWHLDWPGAIGVGTVLWPAFAVGYHSLGRMFGSDADRSDELGQLAVQSLQGFPVLAFAALWSLIVLGGIRLLGSFSALPRGGLLNFVMSLLALHVLAWGVAGAVQWGWSAWRDRHE